MKVKRLIAGAMVFASAGLLAACGSKSSSSTETFNRMEKDPSLQFKCNTLTTRP